MLDNGARSFVDVGCGSGSVSAELCRRGLTGMGIDSSPDAVNVTRSMLRQYVDAGRFEAYCVDVHEVVANREEDVAISMMVAEHVIDDVRFVRAVERMVRPGGQVIIGVPGRRDHWGFEDEVVGHLRRYEREDLRKLLVSAGLTEVRVWSVAVPVANLLYHLGNRLVRRATGAGIMAQSSKEQTSSSGIRDVPWKTVFPGWCAAILNRRTLYPLFLLQRLFYRTRYGVTLLASGRVPR